MELTEIIARVNQSIGDLLKTEHNTLKRGLSERAISSRLADHLRPLFEGYNVDSDYNGDIDKPNDRKAIDIARNRIVGVRQVANGSDNYKITPDIIVHRQGTNEHNLLVIEVKKDVSKDNHKQYDLIKLEHLTINYLGNHYNYRLGIAVVFGTGRNVGSVSKVLFQNGIPITEDLIK